jgi:ribose 5-phosphate isomerase B
MTITLGADHAGTRLKEEIKKALISEGHTVRDVSPSDPEGGDDYPDYAFAVAEEVAKESDAFGILVCDTGIGMAIAANKVPGVSAALVVDAFGARRAREHNNANILVLGSEIGKPAVAKELVTTFLSTPFSQAERHVRRIGKIRYYDQYRQRPDGA